MIIKGNRVIMASIIKTVLMKNLKNQTMTINKKAPNTNQILNIKK